MRAVASGTACPRLIPCVSPRTSGRMNPRYLQADTHARAEGLMRRRVYARFRRRTRTCAGTNADMPCPDMSCADMSYADMSYADMYVRTCACEAGPPLPRIGRVGTGQGRAR